jgi:UDP-N-acetylmuramoylalanine--D-glutamate ligase
MPESLANKKILVQGLGRFGGGIGVTRFLVSQGAHVTVTDTAKEADLKDSLAKLADLPQSQLRFVLGKHDAGDFTSADLVVANPAVDKENSEHIKAARAAGVPITSEMNLFLERNPAYTVGITGSVGKSTTTTLIHLAVTAALTADHRPLTAPQVFLGGNIGKSLLSDLPQIKSTDIVILELSSFMLEDTPAIGWSPNIALVTNIFPNHLDRHKTMAAYTAAKQNILKFQTPDDIAIFNADHDLVSRWTHFARGKSLKFTTRGPKSSWIPLLIPGEHNQSNAQAALAVLDALAPKFKLDRAAAIKAMSEFKGLSHRLQLVHQLKTHDARLISFFNDSKATTPEASMTALDAFDPGSALFIVGGYDKHIDLAPFCDALAKRAGGILGVGETGQAIVDAVKALNPHVLAQYAQTINAAVPVAVSWTSSSRKLQAIVLSPASASYDQFKNYEERGDCFVTLVQQF